jgi:hypothetical protein
MEAAVARKATTRRVRAEQLRAAHEEITEVERPAFVPPIRRED